MSREVIDRTTKLVHDFDARVAATPADAWSKPAPCEGWTARDVVSHVANNLFRTTARLGASETREVGAHENIIVVWSEARDRFLEAMRTADLSRIVEGPLGPMPAEQFVATIISTDVLIHTWDLARSVGGDEQLDAAAVTGAFSGMKPLDAMIRQPGRFDPKIEPPDGADEQTELLCFLGRKV